MPHHIVLHTRGSCDPATKIGGWAAILQYGGHQRSLQGSAADTTVRLIELTAVIEAFSALKRTPSTVQLFTDSNYIVCGVNEWLSSWLNSGWKNARGEPIANLALWISTP
jgi:ribonuclease HI